MKTTEIINSYDPELREFLFDFKKELLFSYPPKTVSIFLRSLFRFLDGCKYSQLQSIFITTIKFKVLRSRVEKKSIWLFVEYMLERSLIDQELFDQILTFDFTISSRPVDPNEIDCIIFGLLKKSGPHTRSKLIAKTNIARSTIYDSLIRLNVEGKVLKFPKKRSTRGRPEILWKINPHYNRDP